MYDNPGAEKTHDQSGTELISRSNSVKKSSSGLQSGPAPDSPSASSLEVDVDVVSAASPSCGTSHRRSADERIMALLGLILLALFICMGMLAHLVREAAPCRGSATAANGASPVTLKPSPQSVEPGL